MIDGRARSIDYLRISVTDRCNLKCVYCIPEEGVQCMREEEYLTIEEITRVCQSVAALGIKKIKLTGGEPLVRKDLVKLIEKIHEIEGIEEITLTTNGILLENQLDALIEAGVTSINISLDTLDPIAYKRITKVDGLQKVLRAIHKASESSLKSVKINTLIAKGLNEEEICRLAHLAKDTTLHVRFIELMPIGCGKHFERLERQMVIDTLEKHFGQLKACYEKLGNGPATYWEIAGFKGKIGFISAVSDCFCEACNRVRLTANGYLKLCLHAKDGVDLKAPLREGVGQETLTTLIQEAVFRKPIEHTLERNETEEDKLMVQIGG